MSNPFLFNLDEDDFNIGRSTRYEQAANIKNNIENIIGHRGITPLILDRPDEYPTSDTTYRWLIPYTNSSSLYSALKQLIVIFWSEQYVIKAEPTSSTHNLVFRVYSSTSTTAIDTITVPVGEYSSVSHGIVPIEVILDTTGMAASFLRLEIDVPADMHIYSVQAFPVYDYSIAYTLEDLQGIGTIHDEGMQAIFNAVPLLKSCHRRIFLSMSREQVITINGTSYADLLDWNIPILGKQYKAETTNSFYAYLYISSVTGAGIKRLRLSVRDSSGSVKSSGTVGEVTTTGWKQIYVNSVSDAHKDMKADNYMNIEGYCVTSGDSFDISSITMYSYV